MKKKDLFLDELPRQVLMRRNDSIMFPTRGSKLEEIGLALVLLREALFALRRAGCKNAADYVARARKSVEGAKRHAVGLEARDKLSLKGGVK